VTIRLGLFGGDADGPKTSVSVEPPELDVRSFSGEPLATVEVHNGPKGLAFWIRPHGEEIRYLCSVAAVEDGVSILLGLASGGGRRR
jgi:hypothetical protein